jgi:hypothetical protein
LFDSGVAVWPAGLDGHIWQVSGWATDGASSIEQFELDVVGRARVFVGKRIKVMIGCFRL